MLDILTSAMIKRNDLPPLNSLPVFIAVMKTQYSGQFSSIIDF